MRYFRSEVATSIESRLEDFDWLPTETRPKILALENPDVTGILVEKTAVARHSTDFTATVEDDDRFFPLPTFLSNRF